MKKLLLLLWVCLPMLVSAQVRIAIVNSQEVFDAMPDKAAAEATLKELSDKYQKEFAQMRSEFDAKFAEYQAVATDADTPATIRERRMQEVQEGNRKLQAFERAAQADLVTRRDALMAPINKKIQAAIRAVGDEGEFDLVLDTATTPVAYAGSSVVDVTAGVMDKLGL